MALVAISYPIEGLALLGWLAQVLEKVLSESLVELPLQLIGILVLGLSLAFLCNSLKNFFAPRKKSVQVCTFFAFKSSARVEAGGIRSPIGTCFRRLGDIDSIPSLRAFSASSYTSEASVFSLTANSIAAYSPPLSQQLKDLASSYGYFTLNRAIPHH